MLYPHRSFTHSKLPPSVATTSTKSPPVIKADIKRVLDRMQVQYREIKTGFECIHLPSIDMSSVEQPMSPSRHHHQSSTGSGEPSTPRASIVKKASKLSFVKKSSKERDASVDKDRPSGLSSGSSSFFNVSSHHTTVPENGVVASPSVEIDVSPPSPQPAKTKVLPPIPKDFASGAISARSVSPMPTGEVDRDVFETMGNNSLSVRFEINIVKVRYHSYNSSACYQTFYSGSLATIPWHTIPTRKWRRVAISDAC